MSGSGKQTTKGKENVKCKECDKIIRKDEMTKHWENKHKHLGGQPKWKFITTGTSDLNKFFPTKMKCEGYTEEDPEQILLAADDNDNTDRVSISFPRTLWRKLGNILEVQRELLQKYMKQRVI